jgi:hypothetical protein
VVMETIAAAGISPGSPAICACRANAGAGTQSKSVLKVCSAGLRVCFPALLSNASVRVSLVGGTCNGKKSMAGVRAQAAQVLEDVVSASSEEFTTVDVDLGDRSYPIYIGKGTLNKPELLQK